MTTSALGAATTPAKPNPRVVHIRKFVCEPPEDAHVLRLLSCEDPPLTLGEWSPQVCKDNAQIPEDVDSRLREHADTESREILANLTWCRRDGTVCYTKRLRCKPEVASDPEDVARAEALGLVGTREGWFLQAQRHQEVMIRSYFTAHQTQISQACQMQREQTHLIGTLGSMLNEAWKNSHAMNIEIDKLRAQQRGDIDSLFDELQAMKASAGTSAESEERSEIMKQILGVLPELLPVFVQSVAGALQGRQPDNDNARAPAPPPAEAAE